MARKQLTSKSGNMVEGEGERQTHRERKRERVANQLTNTHLNKTQTGLPLG